ncbi:MAG: TetR/AcrR family transcriptional regulator [Lachnospiraceae bacterium]|nr:TetR/AcrR family transcriptional regulator [Lachnospiraceae bacterium]
MKDNPNEEKILDAALTVVARETITGTRTRMIADEAGVSPSSIHYYFKSKDELMDKLQKRVLDKSFEFRNQRKKSIDPNNIYEVLDLFFFQKMDFIQMEKDLDYVNFDFWLHSRVDDMKKKSMAEAYQEWREEIREMVVDPFCGDLPESDKEQLTFVLVSLMQGAAIQYHLAGFNLQSYFAYCKRLIRTMLTQPLTDD